MSGPRLSPSAKALLRALEPHLPGMILLNSADEPWASITFTGERHELVLDVPDAAAADRFAVRVADLDFPINGHLVADIAVVSAPDGARRRVVVEALVLKRECS